MRVFLRFCIILSSCLVSFLHNQAESKKMGISLSMISTQSHIVARDQLSLCSITLLCLLPFILASFCNILRECLPINLSAAWCHLDAALSLNNTTSSYVHCFLILINPIKDNDFVSTNQFGGRSLFQY